MKLNMVFILQKKKDYKNLYKKTVTKIKLIMI
jgi:hypothetical protein